jgi:DNA-binding transcriptional ArsR family regulator
MRRSGSWGSSPSRRGSGILLLLCRKELCVCQIMGVLGLPKPLVSRNLALLHRAGLLAARRTGKMMYYRLRRNASRSRCIHRSGIAETRSPAMRRTVGPQVARRLHGVPEKDGKCGMETFLKIHGAKEKETQGMTLSEFKSRRTKLQLYTWPGLLLVAVGGWFEPLLGFLLIGCMLGAIGIAAYGKGRMWCDWMCPRGSFLDLVLARLSRKSRIPAAFRTNRCGSA